MTKYQRDLAERVARTFTTDVSGGAAGQAVGGSPATNGTAGASGVAVVFTGIK